MPNIHRIKPGQFPRAIEWNALAEAYNPDAIGADREGRGFRFRDTVRDGPVVKGKNNSGAARARFECMRLNGPQIALTNDGLVDLIFSLDTANPDEVPAILTAAIDDGQVGDVIIDGLALALVGPAASADFRYAAPDAANHRLAPQEAPTNIRLLANPSTTAATLCPVLIGGGGASESPSITFQIESVSNASGSGDFGAYKSASVTVLTATCGRFDLTGTSQTVYDIIGCYLNEDNVDLEDRKGHAEWCVMDNGGETDCFWEVKGLCCPP